MKLKLNYAFILFVALGCFTACSDDDNPTQEDPKKAIYKADKESLDFGEVESTKTKSLDIVISNTGNATLEIKAISITGTDASQFKTSVANKNIEASKQVTIPVVFEPTDAKSKQASLTIETNVGKKTISLTGLGTALLPDSELDRKDGFLFAYNFDGDLNSVKGSKGAASFTSDDAITYVDGIKTGTKALDLSGKTATVDYTFPSDATEVTISFWVKSPDQFHDLNMDIYDVYQLIGIKGNVGRMDFNITYTKFNFRAGGFPVQGVNYSASFSNGGTGEQYLKQTIWNHVVFKYMIDANGGKGIPNLFINGVKSVNPYGTINNAVLFKDKVSITLNKDKKNHQIDNLKFYAKAQTDDFIINDLGDKSKN